MAIPYIVGSGLTALLGGISYRYFLDDEKIVDELKQTEKIDYSLIDEKLNEVVVSSNKSPLLGVTFKEKSNSIIQICNEQCGLSISYDNSKGKRKRLGKYIREYEKIGLDGFIYNYKKILKKKTI
jgi:hypothetical protein